MRLYDHSQAVLVLLLTACLLSSSVSSQLVPAIITFGDSVVDVGNNDYIHTIFKANYPPYGRDFANQQPTGRFCNGRLATDLTAETLGFSAPAPAYLSPQASGQALLQGANFASAGAGYDDHTSTLNNVISLSQQLEYYKEYRGKLASVSNSTQAASIIRDALYLVAAGSSDFVQNYYVNPLLYKTYTPDQYSSQLVDIFSTFVTNLYSLGARRIGVTSLPPLGCLPAARTLFGFQQSGCVARINTDAQLFNQKINATAIQLRNGLPGARIVVFDIFTPLYDLVTNPSTNGFTEATRGCCGTGTVETTSLLCNQKSIGTCTNASQYVFWDSVHPSEAANQILANSLILQGIDLIS